MFRELIQSEMIMFDDFCSGKPKLCSAPDEREKQVGGSARVQETTVSEKAICGQDLRQSTSNQEEGVLGVKTGIHSILFRFSETSPYQTCARSLSQRKEIILNKYRL